jgi:hypothetical protein
VKTDPGRNTRPRHVWCLTDGRAGNRAQALGLAEALARRGPWRIAERRVVPRPGPARLPARVWHLLSRLLPAWPAAGLAEGAEALRPPWPDLLIGAGRRAAPVVAALGRRQGVRTVQLLDPQMPLGAFDLVVAPEHDRLAGRNMVATLGSVGRLTRARIAEAAAPWRPALAPLPRPRAAVLLGGPSGSARWTAAERARLVRALAGLVEEGWSLVVTPSRRTEPALLDALERAAPPERLWIWSGAGENPYPGILGLADTVIVTADSVNMTSEAAASGLPVHVFAVEGLAPKLRTFHGAMVARGHTRPFEGAVERWAPVPLSEADRVAAIVEARLLA